MKVLLLEELYFRPHYSLKYSSVLDPDEKSCILFYSYKECNHFCPLVLELS
jgi:hypothetical protein